MFILTHFDHFALINHCTHPLRPSTSFASEETTRLRLKPSYPAERCAVRPGSSRAGKITTFILLCTTMNAFSRAELEPNA